MAAVDAIIYTDGGCSGNPGPAGAGYVISAPDGAVLGEGAVPIGQATNNIAEYQGAISALEHAAQFGFKRVIVRSDSELMCKQIWGKYRIKTPHIVKLHIELRKVMEQFEKVTFECVPREHNERADALARQAVEQARKQMRK